MRSAGQAFAKPPALVLCFAVVSFLDKRQLCGISSQFLTKSHTDCLLFIGSGHQLEEGLRVLPCIGQIKQNGKILSYF